MYNSTNTNMAELPSSKSLIKATFTAFLVAIVITVSVVLPAEFGIDVTGIGRVIGLQQMGDIKVSLAQEAEQDALVLQTSNTNVAAVVQQTQPAIQAATVAVTKDAGLNKSEAAQVPSDTRTIVLKNGQAAELKVALKEGQAVKYAWTATDKINFDNHGDSSLVKYLGYSKGRNVAEDNGNIVASFDGYHGWFWRNRSGKSVTIEIAFTGAYSEVKRVK